MLMYVFFIKQKNRLQFSDCSFQIADCRLQIADCRLQIADLEVNQKPQTIKSEY